LGLAIVKQLVEAQNGTINVRSKVGEGSTFSFELEFLKSGSEIFIEPQIDEFEGDVKNVRVLVAEDIPLNQLLMKTLLDDFGFECEIAENGRIAVEKLQNKTFSVVLMDLQMPMMNGFEATDYIRNVLHSDIPIIALTADVTTVDLAKCKAVGMNDYIAKPVDERLLYGKIVGAVKKTNSTEGLKDGESPENQIFKYTDLDYLTRRTKSNPELMMEMITLYLDQTPALVSTMKRSTQEKDWKSLYSAVHKLIPSFSIMGINANFENMAKKVQEYASTQQQSDGILDLVMQLEVVCTKACEELREELTIIKNGNNE
jgi:CheY-like chemotaxis protein